MKKAFLGTAAMLAIVVLAKADTMATVTTRVGNETVNWSQLGPDNTAIFNPFTATSSGGVAVNGSFFGGGQGETSVEGSSWFGDFSVGDALVWTNFPGQGPLTLTLNAGVKQIGAQIQPDFAGPFTAEIDAYNSDNTLLGSFTQSSVTNLNEDGSAIYLGIQDLTAPHINKVVFSLTAAGGDTADFAINQVSLTHLPEPGTWMMMAGGLAVLGAVRRRLAVRR